MKRAMLIIVAGLLLAGVAYGCLYMTRTAQARRANAAAHPELVWLKREFGLSQQEFARIRNLHEAYLPDCARMCAKIEAANTELEALVLKTNQITLEISEKLSDIGRIRQECQTRMLSHFYAVSRSMPEEQGRRYLAQMQKLTSLSNMRHDAGQVQTAHGH